MGNGHKPPKPPRHRPPLPDGEEYARDTLLWDVTGRELWPWDSWGYRGWTSCAAIALGYSADTVRRWRHRGNTGVSASGARRIIALLRHRAERALELADAWDTYRVEREAIEATATSTRLASGYRGRRLRTVDGWASTAPDAVPRVGTHAAT